VLCSISKAFENLVYKTVPYFTKVKRDKYGYYRTGKKEILSTHWKRRNIHRLYDFGIGLIYLLF